MDELSADPSTSIVVGAGVNGVGIARDAALRGLRVALLEQDDICSGVSAWSGRLVHGGLRYLEHRDFALVRESLRERERLFRLAPHLVKPVRLLMPFYAHNRRPAVADPAGHGRLRRAVVRQEDRPARDPRPGRRTAPASPGIGHGRARRLGGVHRRPGGVRRAAVRGAGGGARPATAR